MGPRRNGDWAGGAHFKGTEHGIFDNLDKSYMQKQSKLLRGHKNSPRNGMAKKVSDKTKEPIEIRDVTTTGLNRLSRGPIKIRTSRFGLLRFRMITIGDLDFFQGLIDHNPPAREFVAQLIHHELDTPTLSVESIRSWNEKLTIRVASIWVRNNPELTEYFKENELTIELIKRNITTYMRKCIRQFEFDPSRQSDFDPPLSD
jgi:hypothetical protein